MSSHQKVIVSNTSSNNCHARTPSLQVLITIQNSPSALTRILNPIWNPEPLRIVKYDLDSGGERVQDFWDGNGDGAHEGVDIREALAFEPKYLIYCGSRVCTKPAQVPTLR